MAAPDYKARFSEARTLLDYGYGICKLYQDENMDILPDAIVLGGVKESVSLQYVAVTCVIFSIQMVEY